MVIVNDKFLSRSLDALDKVILWRMTSDLWNNLAVL